MIKRKGEMMQGKPMEERVVRVLPTHEVNELLGFSYYDAVLPTLGWSKEAFVEKFRGYIYNDKFEDSEEQFFDYLIELISLTYNLYKWGQILFGMQQKHYINTILTITLGESQTFAIITELKNYYEARGRSVGENGIVLVDIESDEVVFIPDENRKSELTAIILWLYERSDVGMAVLELDAFDEVYTGSYLSYDEKKIETDLEYMAYIKREYPQYMQRFKALQKIFIENFIRS